MYFMHEVFGKAGSYLKDMQKRYNILLCICCRIDNLFNNAKSIPKIKKKKQMEIKTYI
jgi:hypothetical protein